MRLKTLIAAGLLALAFALTAASTEGANMAAPQHGISFTKGCASPTPVGSPYSCSYTVSNIVDGAGDTLAISGIDDVVHSAGGDIDSGNIFTAVKLDNAGTSATCTGPGLTGTGTPADPWGNATSCTLPAGSTIDVQPSSQYTVQAADFNLLGHQLTDSATLTWTDLCDGLAAGPPPGGGNCNPTPPTAGAASSTLVIPNQSTTTTTVRNAAGATVTTVEAGTTVHDFVAVAGTPGGPVPTGNVTIDWFTNGTCSGSPASTSAPLALDAAGHVDATSFAFTPPAGAFGFLAHYGGDSVYSGSNGTCEPLSVVDANIQITPPTATNPVGTNHVLTVHVNVNPGTGFVNAPAGTTITATLTNTGGATATFVGPSTCTTVGATGSCTVTISSPTAGATTVKATTTVTVGGLPLTRTTGDGKPGDSVDAQKLWTTGGGVVTQFCVACQDVLTANVPPQFVIGNITYGQFAGRIHGRAPGQLYYWAIVTTTTPNQVVTVSQSNTSTNNTVPLKVGTTLWLYSSECKVVSSGTANASKTGASFTVATPGTYALQVEFDTNVLENQPVPVPSTIQYTFTTSLGSSASVTLQPQ
jgi:hypothetical protein